jgi:peptidoglycan/LPS O-acetylase OafA/YrhL
VHTDLLFIVAEIGAAFAGFATLVAVISDRSGRSEEQVRLHLRMLQNALIGSLLAVAFALLPSVISRQAVDPTVAWRSSAAFCSFALGSYIAYVMPRLLRAQRVAGRSVSMAFVLNTILSCVWVVVFAGCAVGALPTSSYLIALTGLLGSAGAAFLRFFLSLGTESDAA